MTKVRTKVRTVLETTDRRQQNRGPNRHSDETCGQMLQQVFRLANLESAIAGLSFRVMKIVPSPIFFIPLVWSQLCFTIYEAFARRLVEIPTFALPRLLAAIVMVSTSRHGSETWGGTSRQFPLNIWWYAPRIWPYPIYCSRIWPSGGIPWTFGKPDLQTKRCIHFWNDPLDGGHGIWYLQCSS